MSKTQPQMPAPNDDTGQQRQAHGRFRWPVILVVALVIALLIVYGGYSAISRLETPSTRAHASAPAQQAIPYHTPAPVVVYQADWSHGADGWTLPPHWQIVQGQLVNDGYGDNTIPVPVTVTDTNYAVEMNLQVLSMTNGSGCGNFFGFVSQNAQGTQQYEASVSCMDAPPPFHGQSNLITTDSFPSGVKVADFVVGSSPRTYRVEVRGNGVSFFPEQVAIARLSSPIPLSPAHLFIEDSQVRMIITSFAILKL